MSLIIATRGSNVKTTHRKSRPETLFQLLTFTCTNSSMSSGVILLQRPYISFKSPLLLILYFKAEEWLKSKCVTRDVTILTSSVN